MAETRDTLRDDLMALLAAGRELPPDSDADLAAVFLDRLRDDTPQRESVSYWRVSKRAASLVFVGVVWLVAAGVLAAIPYYYYTHDSDVLSGYYAQTVPTVLAIAVTLTLVTCAAAITDWRLPRIRIIIPPPREDA